MNENWFAKINKNDLATAISHMNKARYEEEPVERYELLLKSLNQLWKAFWMVQPLEDKEKSDNQAIRNLLLNALTEEHKEKLCKSNELLTLVNLKPLIMNHDKLLKEKYNPEKIDSKIRKEAEKDHYRLIKAYENYSGSGTKSKTEDVIKKLGTLLYIIRSNNAHGEKTPYGPDLKKIERDQTVCKYAYPVVELILDFLLDEPSKKLVVYGTLAPGKVNASMLEKIKGEWSNGFVVGELRTQDWPRFEWKIDGEKIQIKLFISDDLPRYWTVLDAFESPSYKRILVPVEQEGNKIIANIYASA